MKIIFAGTPNISATVLNKLIDSTHDIVAVYTQPDRPKGRGRQLAASPVKELAMTNNIKVCQPDTLKTEQAQKELSAFNADLMIVVAYGMILPQTILDTPKRGCWNIHVSLLPRWRGAAPIQRAIEAGDEQTGVAIMQMDAGLDTGDILLSKSCPIKPTDTSQTLHDKLADLGAEALMEALDQIEHLTPQKQDEQGITYAHKLKKEEALIDWHLSAKEVDCKIRAYIPYPIACFELGEEIIKIHAAHISDTTGTPGKILSADKKGIVIACADQSICITHLQFPGKKAMSAADVLNSKKHLFS